MGCAREQFGQVKQDDADLLQGKRVCKHMYVFVANGVVGDVTPQRASEARGRRVNIEKLRSRWIYERCPSFERSVIYLTVTRRIGYLIATYIPDTICFRQV